MQRFTIREMQHNLASILKIVKSGQTVTICHRKTPVARLIPSDSTETADWSNHEKEIMGIFQGRTLRPQPTPGIISETRDEF
ncbi:MAG: type II toxin-antitoxin system prevent-host-death family antitoxin [Spirochaetales bacterium]|nr:type II toxin-antitoxin system prevent-host-death family antitoxin [Spirochaetales bacterium]